MSGSKKKVSNLTKTPKVNQPAKKIPQTAPIKKKKNSLPIYQIIYHCIDCQQEYQTVSTSSQNIRISSCSNCNPFYTGASASEIKVGEVEKFRQRMEKTRIKSQK